MSTIYRCPPYCRNAVGDDWTYVVEVTFPKDPKRLRALAQHEHDRTRYVFASDGVNASNTKHYSRWVFKYELDAMQFLLEQA